MARPDCLFVLTFSRSGKILWETDTMLQLPLLGGDLSFHNSLLSLIPRVVPLLGVCQACTALCQLYRACFRHIKLNYSSKGRFAGTYSSMAALQGVCQAHEVQLLHQELRQAYTALQGVFQAYKPQLKLHWAFCRYLQLYRTCVRHMKFDSSTRWLCQAYTALQAAFQAYKAQLKLQRSFCRYLQLNASSTGRVSGT